jgi:hypothetical protein
MLMTVDYSAKIMDEIFTSGSEESQARLLKIIQDFLVSEAAKHSAKEKGTLLMYDSAHASYSQGRERVSEEKC